MNALLCIGILLLFSSFCLFSFDRFRLGTLGIIIGVLLIFCAIALAGLVG